MKKAKKKAAHSRVSMPKLVSHLKEDIKQDKSLLKMASPSVRKMAKHASRGK